MSAAAADPLRQVRESIDEGTPPLRLSQRRPSVPTEEGLSRFAARELTIAHEGWLTKHSKTGLPNWNRRWFVLIGGTLYYGKTSAGSHEEHQMQRFAELMHAVRVEPVSSDSCGFRLVLSDQTLQFQASSTEARLEWCAQLESHIGWQPVPLEVLQNCMRKESASDATVRLRALAGELLDKEAELRAAAAREAELRETVAALQAALVAKDEQLWALASDLAVATEGGGGSSALSEEASDRLTALAPNSSSGSSPSELRIAHAVRSNSDDLVRARRGSDAASPAAAVGSLLSERSGVHPERSLKKCNTCDCGKAAASAPAAAVAPSAAPDGRSTMGSLLGRKGSAAAGKGDSNTSLAGKVAGGGGALAASLGLRLPGKPAPKGEAPSSSDGGVSRNAKRRGSAPMATFDVGKPPGPASQGRSRSHTASDMQVPGGPSSSQPPPHGANGSQLRVSKQGWLTKFSKGGFTANWNRRAFVLIGSSLYYARTHEALPSKPQLFAELHMCEVLPWADYATAQQNVFGVHVYAGVDAEHAVPSPRRGEGGNGHEGQDPDLLLLAADTGREKFEWMHVIEEARKLPPCPVELVAQKLAQAHALAAQGANLHDHPPRPLYKRTTSTDSKLVAAPQTPPPQSPASHRNTPGSDRNTDKRRHDPPRNPPRSAPSSAERSVGNRDERSTGNPHRPAPSHSESSASGMFGSMLDRIMPDFVKDI